MSLKSGDSHDDGIKAAPKAGRDTCVTNHATQRTLHRLTRCPPHKETVGGIETGVA